MHLRTIKRGLFAMAVAVLVGCASHESQYDGVTFLAAPEDISSAWKSNDGDVYIVPEKGVIVEQVVGKKGDELEWSTAGAYLVLPSSVLANQNDGRIWLKIEGKLRLLDTSARSRF